MSERSCHGWNCAVATCWIRPCRNPCWRYLTVWHSSTRISQAADHYLNAIEAFYEETNRIDRTISHIESGQFFDDFVADDPLDSTGWYWRMEQLPRRAREARYLFHLLATHEFQEGLKNYRDLNYLWNNLDDWMDNVQVYANMLETRRLAYQERIPEGRCRAGTRRP